MKTVEISLKEMVLTGLRHWKMILALALVLAALFGAYGYFFVTESNRTANAAYQEQIKLYRADLAEKQQRLEGMHLLRNEDGTIKNPPTLQADAYSKREAFHIFTVAIPQDVLREYGEVQPSVKLADRIVSTYFANLEKMDLNEVLKEYFPLTGSINPYDVASFILDQAGGIITINVSLNQDMNPDLVPANIVQTIFREVYRDWQRNKDVPVAHELVAVKQGNRRLNDTAGLLEAQKQLDTLTNEIARLEAGQPKLNLGINGAKLIALGALIGLIAGILLVVIAQLVRLTLRYPEQLANTTGLRFLGGRTDGRFHLTNLAGGQRGLTKGTAFAPLLQANVARLVQPGSKVLLTGSLPQDDLDALAAQLAEADNPENLVYLAGADITENPETVRLLPQTDAVLLVERLHKSRTKPILMQKDRLAIAEKPLLGYVLL